MLCLRMLGGLSIGRAIEPLGPAASFASTDAVPKPLSGAATQRRPLALLAFLATAREGGRSRDEVLLHLWPDSTPARARNVLKQTLYALRRDLGTPDLVIAYGDRLRLNPVVITSDVAELEATLERGETERALELYRGPFLNGVSLGDVPEFERWVQEQRERLAALVDIAGRAGATEPRPNQRMLIDANPRSLRRRRTSKRLLAGLAISALAVLTGIGALRAARRAQDRGRGSVAAAATVIAVLPFEVASADTALRFLENGMVELLTIRLTGDSDGSLRAIAPTVVLNAWRRLPFARDGNSTTALQLAAQLGAGRVLRGNVVGTPAHLVLTAEMRAASNGNAVAHASVTGSADSLSVLVDRLAGMLLLSGDVPDAGADPAVRRALAATSLAAIRDYVEGTSAYRAGRYDEAVKYFDRSLARDSTFALAALGLARSAGWAGASQLTIQRGVHLAWRYGDRLPRRASLALAASVGGVEALRSGYAPETTQISAAERAAEANPDDPETWYWLGDRYLHLGPAMGLAAPLERAAAAFRRSVSLDPTFVPPFIHLVQVEARLGDTGAVRRIGTQLLQYDSTSESAQFIRWRMSVALGDTATLRTIRARFDQMPVGALRLILMTAECDAVDLKDADGALAAMLRRAATDDERTIALIHAHTYALNRGRRVEALRVTEALTDAEPVPRWRLRIRVLDALYGGGDTIAARAAVDSLSRFADAPLASDARARMAQYEDITAVTQWQLWHGDRRGLEHALQRLAAVASPPDSLRQMVANRISAALLRAVAANTAGSRDLASVAALDELLATNVEAPFAWPRLYPALVAARLFVLNGQPTRALRSVRRRADYFPESTYLAASLALEARLVSQLGDSASAVNIGRELHALGKH